MSTPSIYELKPSWSRLIHRIHTLGITQHSYINQIASLSEERIYPRQVPSFKEDSSHSLDGTHLWKMNNWHQGWVIINEGIGKASFIFCSKSNGIFHKIDLVDQSQWDCLDCLLKVFVKHKVKSADHIPLRSLQNYTNSNTADIGGIAELIGKNITNGGQLAYTLPTSGGLITRKHKIKKMITQDGYVKLRSPNGRLIINSSQVKHVEVTHHRNGFLGTFYNTMGSPQLIIEAA